MTTETESLNFLGADEVARLADTYGTPLFVYDLASIRRRYEYLSGLPSAYGLTVRYSVKANPNRSILALFHSLGAFFDVSSVWEARRAVRAGVPASKILMTAQEASAGWDELVRQGMEFDCGSIAQLKAYAALFPNTEASVRFNPGFGSGLVKKLTSGGPHSSFGIWHERLPEVQAIAAEHGLTIKRMHFHIGSGHEGVVLERTVDKALELCEQLPSVRLLNLGGGYRLAALKSDHSPDHQAMARRIAAKLEAFAARTGRRLHLELEPGTYAMSMSGSLIARVIDAVDTGAEGHRFLKLDAGLTELIRPSYYGALHPLVTVRRDGTLPQSTMQAMVVGHCCIAGDNLTPKPGNMEDFQEVTLGEVGIGDLMVVERAGGYAASMSLKNFNSYPEATELLRVKEGTYTVIRTRQTLEHLVHNEPAVPIEALNPPATPQRPAAVEPEPEPAVELAGDLEGDINVHLAPVRGKDIRRDLPREMFARPTVRFVAKFVLAFALIAAGWAAFVLDAPLPVLVAAFLLNGLMYAHLVELQHECLHAHAFKSVFMNRVFGVLCGIPMMSSFSHYRYDHLRHHAFLGTPTNREHFNYRFQHLDSLSGFAASFFDLSRFRRVGEILMCALAGRPVPGVDKPTYSRHIKQEYVLYAALAVAGAAWSLETGSWLVVLAWFLPSLLVAEGVHFMIEMPEHFGLNTQTEPNVLSNTRTIYTSPLVSWFVNGNDLHTAHHFHQGVPVGNIRSVHSLISDRIAVVESSYFDFYRKVIRGDIRQPVDATCMTR